MSLPLLCVLLLAPAASAAAELTRRGEATRESRMAAGEHGTWKSVASPAPRAWHESIHDPVRNRMIVFGGDPNDEVWALPLSGEPEWTRLTPGGTPPSDDAKAIHDPVRDRMVFIAGYGNVWALSLGETPEWTAITPVGTPPGERCDQTMIYDPARDRILVFAGSDCTLDFQRNDVWALTLSGSPAWIQLAPTGPPPPPRERHAAVYEAAGDRMIVHGGYNLQNDEYIGDAWALSLSGTPVWTSLTPSGPSPGGRAEHAAVYDPQEDRMVIFGGLQGSFPYCCQDDAWGLTLSGTPEWIPLGPTGTPPEKRRGHTGIYDPAGDRMVVFGGYTVSNVTTNDAWTLSLSGAPTWSALAPNAGGPPGGRFGHTAVRDPVRNRMLVFGGNNGSSVLNEVWEFTISGTPAWRALAPTGTPPSPRSLHAATYDPFGDRLLVFGGQGSAPSNDLWGLSLSADPAWNPLSTIGTPPSARFGHSASYDALRGRMVVFGGTQETSPYDLNDVFVVSLSPPLYWSPVAPTGSAPGGRSGHSAIYDPVRDRVVFFGGREGSGACFNDVWELSLAGTTAWTALAPTGTPPSGRSGHTAIYDAVRDRMVIFGGVEQNPANYLNDVWVLSLTGTPAWTALAPGGTSPSPRERQTAIYDPEHDRMVIFGGRDGSVSYDDVSALVWSTPTDVPGSFPPVARLEFSSPRPNPFRREVTFELTLPQQGTVSLTVFDLAGRAVRRLVQGVRPPGRHSFTWDGKDFGGRSVPDGMYFARANAFGTARTTKAILAR